MSALSLQLANMMSSLALVRYTQLESLILNTKMLDRDKNSADWFIEALSFVRCPSLHTITFIYGQISSVERVAEGSQLPALDAILSHKPFLHIRRIVVEIGVYVEKGEDAATKLQLIERYVRVDALRQCQQRGVLVQVNCHRGCGKRKQYHDDRLLTAAFVQWDSCEAISNSPLAGTQKVRYVPQSK